MVSRGFKTNQESAQRRELWDTECPEEDEELDFDEDPVERLEEEDFERVDELLPEDVLEPPPVIVRMTRERVREKEDWEDCGEEVEV